MTPRAYKCNGYNLSVGHLNQSKRVALRINKLPETLDKHLVPFSTTRRFAEDNKFLPSELRMLRHDSDEYCYDSGMMLRENSLGSELRQIRNGQSTCYRSNSKYRLNQKWNYVGSPTSAVSDYRGNKQPQKQVSREDFVVNTLWNDDFSSNGLPNELGLDLWNMYNCPPSPIFQVPSTPMENNCSDLNGFYSPMTMRALLDLSAEDPGNGSWNQLRVLDYEESMDGLFLYVTTDDLEKLDRTLRERSLAVQDIGKTRMSGVLAVLFSSHEIAKRAFTTQQEFGIRMEPPKKSKRNWYKNPNPKFHVKFETTRRLTVKTGKSISKGKVGDFLMSDARMDKGCIIWADQLKGHRLRVVGFVGRFMDIGGHIIERHDPPLLEDRQVIGWISTQCNKTKKKFVIRKSGNHIEDYTHTNGIEALE